MPDLSLGEGGHCQWPPGAHKPSLPAPAHQETYTVAKKLQTRKAKIDVKEV